MTNPPIPPTAIIPTPVTPTLPEPTSYPGRNYIGLGLSDDYFTDTVRSGAPVQGASIAAGAPLTDAKSQQQTIANAMKAGFPQSDIFTTPPPYAGLVRAVESADGTMSLTSSESLHPKLASLQPADVLAAQQAGQQIVLYRSMSGSLTYRTVQADVPGAADPIAGRDEGKEPGYVEPRDTDYGISIDSPSPNATFSGPKGGVSVTVMGTTYSTIASRRAANVSVDFAGTPGSVTPLGPANNPWSTWKALATLTTAGSKTITATGTFGIAKPSGDQDSVDVTIVLVDPAQNDITKPDLAITSPLDGATIYGTPGNTHVAVKGTGSDTGSGVASVTLIPDHDPSRSVVATPNATGDWSSWSGSVPIDVSGDHTVTVRCADKAGNVREETLHVTVVIQGPVYRLLIVESYRLSSYLGAYGPGRVIKTFSLLPGEQTHISVSSYLKSETDAKSASSILDSFTQTSADDFENSVTAEQSNKEGHDESFKYHVDAKVGASWGWGSAEVSGGIAGSSHSAREEFAKNLSVATQKHAANASAKRDVQINTSYEVQTQQGVETSIQRVISNINVSRTLNFISRQMNQEFLSLLHLVDVRVAFYRSEVVNGTPVTTYVEATLPQFDGLLAQIIVEDKRHQVRNMVIDALTYVFDFTGKQTPFVEAEPLVDLGGNPIPGTAYLRVKQLQSVYQYSNGPVTVPGVILSASTNVLRTDGILIDAVLGEGEALDTYSQGLQLEGIAEKHLANAAAQAEIDKTQLALDIIRSKDADKARLFQQLFPTYPEFVVSDLPNLTSSEAPASSSTPNGK